MGVAEIFSASVGTAADAGDDGVVVACANAVSGVAHSSRITDMRTRLLGEMTGEKPANEICVVIDSGEPKLSPHVLTRCHPDKKWDPEAEKMFL